MAVSNTGQDKFFDMAKDLIKDMLPITYLKAKNKLGDNMESEEDSIGDIYEPEQIEQLEDDDEMSPIEAAFMQGYNEAEY